MGKHGFLLGRLEYPLQLIWEQWWAFFGDKNSLVDVITDEYCVNSFYNIYIVVASLLLLVLLVWQVGGAFRKRLRLLQSFKPSQILALNAFTLALINIVAKLPKPGHSPWDDGGQEYSFLFENVLICCMMGAFMPSMATSISLTNMWSNLAAVGLLSISSNFLIFLQMFTYQYWYGSTVITYATRVPHCLVMAVSLLLFCVLLTQAMALEAMVLDVKHMVSKKLGKLKLSRPSEATVLSWEEVEKNTYMKLLMLCTSNMQNVVARSPCVAIVAAFVSFSFGTSIYIIYYFDRYDPPYFIYNPPRSEYKSGDDWLTDDNWIKTQYHPPTSYNWITAHVRLLAAGVCAFVSVWRCLRIALHEDRPLKPLLKSSAEQHHWHRRMKNVLYRLQSGPRRMQPSMFREVLHHLLAFTFVLIAYPIHRMLVSLIIYTHVFSALIMQKLISLTLWCTPPWLVACGTRVLQLTGLVETAISSQYFDESQDIHAVVCLPGEAWQMVRKQFLGTANFIIQQQIKRAAMPKSDVKALVSFLWCAAHSTQLGTVNFSNGKIQDVLDQRGAPHIPDLEVEHGYQYGWRLTTVSLLAVMSKIEGEALGTSELSERAINAYCQAMEMMRIVDEQCVPCNVCSNDTYASAVALQWSKLPNVKHRKSLFNFRWKSQRSLDQILDALLTDTRGTLHDFNHTFSPHVPWPVEIVASYTMHTVCGNLRRWHINNNSTSGDVEDAVLSDTSINSNDTSEVEFNISKAILKHINHTLIELMSCCVFNLPVALDMRMTDAVQKGSVAHIQEGILLIARSKQAWAELQWPSPPCTTRGQLRQYFI